MCNPMVGKDRSRIEPCSLYSACPEKDGYKKRVHGAGFCQRTGKNLFEFSMENGLAYFSTFHSKMTKPNFIDLYLENSPGLFNFTFLLVK